MAPGLSVFWVWEDEMVARGIDCFGGDEKRDAALVELPEGREPSLPRHPTFLESAIGIVRPCGRPRPKRLGNLFIFHGTFYLPGQAASELYFRGLDRLYGEKPDDTEAEKSFRRSADLDPMAYFVHIQLGNLYLKGRSREKCVRAYSEALRYAPEDPEIRSALQNQIERVSRKDLAEVTPLRDPHME